MIHVYPQLADDASAPPAAPTPWPTLQPSARLLLPAPEPPVPYERLPYQQWREALARLENPVHFQGPPVTGYSYSTAKMHRLREHQPQTGRFMLPKLPQVRLALSVLYVAALDLLAPKRPRDHADAVAWIFNASTEEQSFEWWCGIADVNPGGTRRLLAKALFLGQVPVGYNVFAYNESNEPEVAAETDATIEDVA